MNKKNLRSHYVDSEPNAAATGEGSTTDSGNRTDPGTLDESVPNDILSKGNNSAEPIQEESGSDWHRPDDRFIPLRPAELESLLLDDADELGTNADELRKIFADFRLQIENEAISYRRLIESDYSAFDPDRDTMSLLDLDSRRKASDYSNFYQRLGFLLNKANFEKLSDIQIEQAVQKANSNRISVRVKSEAVDHLEIWVRGHGTVRYRKTSWRHPINGVEVESEVFRRMMIVARLHDDPHVIIKLFKDIPESDVEALLPHAQASMTLLDRIKLLGSGAGAFGATLTKLIGFALGFAALGKILWILIFGLLGFLFKTALGYRTVRNTREGQMARHLYFQNLANNASAVQWLVSTIKQEEIKEAYLGYVFACRQNQLPSTFASDNFSRTDPASNISAKTMCKPTAEAIGDEIEQYLNSKLDVSIDFDIHDSINTLIRLGAIDAMDGKSELSPKSHMSLTGSRIARNTNLIDIRFCSTKSTEPTSPIRE